ncbi:MAG: GrpB family protein, partial [Chloroflexi bacterium]|nr:GrpB family protein [Chloroflexota bacterium]
LFALGFGRQRNRDPFPETRPMRTGVMDYEGETFLLHVHVVPDSAPDMTELLNFRDRLRTDPNLVAEYVAAKRQILQAGVLDGVDYAEKKGTFITALGYNGAEDA